MTNCTQQNKLKPNKPFWIYHFTHPQCLIDIAINGLLTLTELPSGMSDSYKVSRELLSNLIPEYRKAIFFFKFPEDIPLDYSGGDNAREISLRIDINNCKYKCLEADYYLAEEFYLCFNTKNIKGLSNLLRVLKYKNSIKPFNKNKDYNTTEILIFEDIHPDHIEVFNDFTECWQVLTLNNAKKIVDEWGYSNK